MRVDAWPDSLAETEIAGVFARVTERSRDIDRTLATMFKDLTWSRLKANDRVYYRLAPLEKLEALLSRALQLPGRRTILIPWLADRYDLIERNGMLGLDAPGHQVVAMLDRLRQAHTFDVHELWPGSHRREPRRIVVGALAMAAARLGTLSSRRVRDLVNPFPAGRPGVSPLPSVGYVVWGASQWASLSPLVDSGRDRHHPVVIAADIFRHPSSYRTLSAVQQPFVPVDSLLSVPATCGTLAQAIVAQVTTTRRLRAAAARTRDSDARERLLVPTADVASLPELSLYIAQLRAAIRKYRLRALVSANNIDAFLGATTVAARAEGISHTCIHNTALERVPLPAYADCDLYVTDSNSYASYLESQGALGRVEALGLPTYDALASAAQKKGRGAVLTAFPHLAGRKIVGVTTQTSWIDFRPLLEALVTWSESQPDVAVVIKLHPRENGDAYADIVQRLEQSGRGGRLHHVSFPDFLCDCDCLVAGASTTLFWATVMGVRPFSWAEPNIKLMAVGLDYLSPEVTTAAETPAGVVAAVDRYIRGVDPGDDWQGRRTRYLTEQLTGADGRACARILQRIDELAGIAR
jgi:hypothetical protein